MWLSKSGVRAIEVDLEILMHLGGLTERHLEGWDIRHSTKIVEEFAHTLEKELNYTMEAAYTREGHNWLFSN